MTEILLVTLNSTYQHSSFGLRYLQANLKELQSCSKILEFTINQSTRDIVEKIIFHKPKIVGFGVYIWNTKPTEEVVRILKKVCPDVTVVLGGPEVTYETESQSIVAAADYVIRGEADFLFYDFCSGILTAKKSPSGKIISGPLPEIQQITLPYDLYSDEDIRNRVIYVEASRGCPYKCEYCLSSLDKSVRNFPIADFLKSMDQLIERGVRQFKFVDRTFNLSPSISTQILEFFLSKINLGLFLHFEMVPDRLPDELKKLIEQFPAGSLQFEIGIQTWNTTVAANVSRRQDFQKVEQNFIYLKEKTHVHTHADLIVGLPGESIESFAQGFNSLSKCRPDEIQVGILKRLKGAPIIRHDKNYEMIYQDHPPFQILKTKDISFEEMQFMNRFAKFWDLYASSGHFQEYISWLQIKSQTRSEPSFFHEFCDFVIFLNERHKESFGISLINLFESAWLYLLRRTQDSDRDSLRLMLARDFIRDKKRDLPSFLRQENLSTKSMDSSIKNKSTVPTRQSRFNS